jgi:Flp pilus assembly protein TadD
MTLRELGDHEGAIRELRLTLRLSPTSPQVARQLADLLIQEGRIEEAVSEMSEAAVRGSDEAREVLAEIEARGLQEK